MLAESHDGEQIVARVATRDIGKAEVVRCDTGGRDTGSVHRPAW